MGWEFAADPERDCADGQAGGGAGDSGGGGWGAVGLAAGPEISPSRAGAVDVWAAAGIWEDEGRANRRTDRSDVSEDAGGVEGEVSGVEELKLSIFYSNEMI